MKYPFKGHKIQGIDLHKDKLHWVLESDKDHKKKYVPLTDHEREVFRHGHSAGCEYTQEKFDEAYSQFVGMFRINEVPF